MQSKNKQGFSLVEALVVAVIIGILAAVAIPTYTGFINDQRVQTLNSLAETAAASANAYYRRIQSMTAVPTPILKNATPLFLYFDDAKYTITWAGTNITVTEKNGSAPKSVTVPYR